VITGQKDYQHLWQSVESWITVHKWLREEPIPGQGDFGTTLYATPGVLGVYAMQEVRTDLTLPVQPPDRWLYAPTLECPNKASLESVTVYKRAGTDSSTVRVYAVWNHITGGFVVWKPMDSTWLNTYTRIFAEGRMYSTEVIKLNNYWKVLLYNFNTSSWDLQASYFTETSRTDGWDIWESIFNGTCPRPLPNIESNKLQVWHNGTWKYVTPNSGFEGEWLYQWTCGYPKGWTDPFFHWWVNS